MAMITQHRWGSPIVEENLLSVAAIETADYPTASDVFDELRSAQYITDRGKDGTELDNANFRDLTDVLYDECGWEPDEIRLRLKHHHDWDQHDWA